MQVQFTFSKAFFQKHCTNIYELWGMVWVTWKVARKIHVFTFFSHAEGYSHFWSHVLLLSSHIWQQGCTCSKNLHLLVHLPTYFHPYFSIGRVPSGCLHSFQDKSYIFEGISHHLGSSHITQVVSTYVEAWLIILVDFGHHLQGNKEVSRKCPSLRLTNAT